jgi:phenylalanine ammonia-lyase
METPTSHMQQTLEYLKELQESPDQLVLNGKDLNIVQVLYAAQNTHVKVTIAEPTKTVLLENSQYLQEIIDGGKVIYGVNTGYGGSADVRSSNICDVQRSLIRHLNAGFGDTLPKELVRAVMLVRANSLCRGYSGVRPETVQLLLDMLEHDIVPVVPKRGSVSASGDLMPTSYIAACMMGRPDAKVIYNDQEVYAPEAFERAGMKCIEFITKEALAVVNASSFASSLAAMVLYDANIAALLTQVVTSMSVECLLGRVESFHPTIHQCMPHDGQKEAARNIRHLLIDSKFAIQILDMDREDQAGVLKQDRYALRTSPQWLAPVLETLQASGKRIMIEINSANDNPIIDHRQREILHCGNFQGVSITVAMDQSRQALQLCGKLMFAQLSEILNWKYSNGLPPNLSGCDINCDFGFKGTDTAMASYCSELDYLTNPLSNHVLSAEMHNQAINSMALVSARMTSQALEILQMMLANILCAQVQALDLRWLQKCVENDLTMLVTNESLSNQYTRETWPWYDFAFTPQESFGRLYEKHIKNGLTRGDFVSQMTFKMESHIKVLTTPETAHPVVALMGQGMVLWLTKLMVYELYYISFEMLG